ncbi:Putative phenylacetate-CoA ligase [Planktothrix tepida]|uniref:Phenylacetate-CoA ligase n=2 Tax=Planktothrix TaxID=54304 RepID=A0A1J1LJN6_9CYAN
MGQLRDEQRQRAISALNGFLSTPLSDLIQPSPDRGVTSVLQLFQQVVTTVPAYQRFLAEYYQSIPNIKTLEDFQTLPLITKENYLRQYSLSQLCRNGQLETCDLIAVSSGSTGNPTF